jgi:histidyl-tRNA synthetase
VPVGDGAELPSLRLAETLRCAGFVIDQGYSGNVGRRLKRANKIAARAAILLGEDELKNDAATVRDLDSGEQVTVPLGSLEDHLARFR